MLSLLLLCAAAQADVAVPLPGGQRSVSAEVEVAGLADHPDVALLVYDPGETIGIYALFSAETAPRRGLKRGLSNRGVSFGSPEVFLLPLDAAKAWEAATQELVAQQRADCEQGIGCAHISRFEPSYPPPRGVISCNTRLQLPSVGPEDGPDTVVEVFSLTEATAERCVLESKGRKTFLGGAELAPSKSTAAPVVPEPDGGSAGGCATATGAASFLTGLFLLLGLAPRRRS